MPDEKQEMVPLAQVEARTKEIFNDPLATQKVVELLTTTRPLTYHYRSNAPYYKEVYGKMIQRYIDQMLLDKQPRIFPYAKYCGPGKMAENTLYAKINYGFRYLVDRLDTPDKKYARASELIQIRRKGGVGVVMMIVETMGDSNVDLEPEVGLHPLEGQHWKDELDLFLERSAPGEQFVKENLMLSPDEIGALKTSLAPLKNIISLVTAFQVKVIRINPPTEETKNETS